MNQNVLQFEEKKKEAIGKITGILIDQMAQKKINQSQSQEIAKHILEQLKKVSNELTLIEFLKQLAEKYPIFNQYYTNISLEDKVKKNDEKKIDLIMTQLSELANFKTK